MAKLATRRSTPGASRDERIDSIMESTGPIYRTRSQNSSRRRSGRADRYETEYEYEPEVLPRSARLKSRGYARSPKVDYSTTSCSISTTSSMHKTEEYSPLQLGRSWSFRRKSSRGPSPSNRRRSTSLTRQSSRDPSPSNMRRSWSFRRQSSRDQWPSNMRRSTSLNRQSSRQLPSPNMRRSASFTQQSSRKLAHSNKRQSASLTRQYKRDSSPSNMRRSSTNSRQSSLRSSSQSRQSSRQTSRNPSSARSRHSSGTRSRHSSSTRSPARSRQSSSRQSSRNPSVERSRHHSRPRSSAKPRSMSRQSSRNLSPARTRHYSNTPPQSILKQSSSFHASGQSLAQSSGQAPRQSARQSTRQSSSKVSRSRSRTRSKSGKRSFTSSVLGGGKNTPSDHYEEKIELVAMRNENNQPFVRILVSKTSYKPKTGHGVEVVPNSEVKRSRAARVAHRRGQGNERENEVMVRENVKQQGQVTKEEQSGSNRPQYQGDLSGRMDTGTVTTTNNTPIMDSIADVAVTCVVACTQPVGCTKPMEGPYHEDSCSPTYCTSPEDEWIGDERDDRNAATGKGLFSNTKFDLAERYAKKEQEREEKKQKKIQKRLDKAKRQIEKELLKQEEIKKNAAKREMRRSSSYNSSNGRRRGLPRSRSDNRLYGQPYEEEDILTPRVVKTVDDDLSSSSSERGGVFGMIKASLSNDRPRAPVRSVSFVSSDDRNPIPIYSDDDDSSRNTAAFQRNIHRGQGTSLVTGFGNICDCGVQDARDMRMVESDISSSTDDDSSTSSSYRYHSYQTRRY